MKNKLIDKNIERRLAKLDALEAGGVDNWDYYGDALSDYNKTIGREEAVEAIVDEIFEAICTHIEQPAGLDCGFGFNPKAYDVATTILLNHIKELHDD